MRFGQENDYNYSRKLDEDQKRAYYVEKIFANALNQARVSSTPILSNSDIYVNPQTAFQIIDTQEKGELIYAEVATNSALMIPELILYDEKQQPTTVINKMNFLELLQIGRGMTPGRVQAAATGQTQDEEGFFLTNMFHIARYKDDTLADWTINANSPTASERWFVGRFVASVPFPYAAISFYIKNTTTDLTAKRIFSYSLARTVYEQPGSQQTITNPQPAVVEIANAAELDESEIDFVNEDPDAPNVNYNASPTGS